MIRAKRSFMKTQDETGPGTADLVASARSGDDSAFDLLYRRFAASVHGVLLARLSAEETEDLMQEVFLTAHRQLGTLDQPEAFGPWLHSIARHLAAGRLKVKARRPAPALLGEVPAPVPQEGDLQRQILALLQTVPEAYRETLMLRLVEGLTGPQIADLTGMTPGSVRVNLHRGMELIRSQLRREGWR